MATLKISPKKLTVSLDWWEKLAAHRSDLSVPTRSIVDVGVVDDVFALPEVAAAEGEPATRIKGLTTTGTVGEVPGAAGTSFVVCHRRPGSTGGSRGLRVELHGVTFGRIIVTSPHPEADAAALRKVMR